MPTPAKFTPGRPSALLYPDSRVRPNHKNPAQVIAAPKTKTIGRPREVTRREHDVSCDQEQASPPGEYAGPHRRKAEQD